METFHATRRLDLTIMVDDLGMIATYEHCLCTMFTFQLGSLHIFEDVLYDPNNFVSSSLYQIPTTSSQGRQWVVGYGHYRIVGDKLAHNFQETILMVGITSSTVKTMK